VRGRWEGYEEDLYRRGFRLIAGLDEVGRGAIAGPVVAAAVVLPFPLEEPWAELVRDSKELTPQQREFLARKVRERALGVGVGLVPPPEIDEHGIVEATRRAMARAITRLRALPQFLLIDALTIPGIDLPQKAIIKGDRLCFSIACASIVAKVTRDRLMRAWHRRYPGYGFDRNKGYATREHIEALGRLGPSPLHRLSFAPLSRLSSHVPPGGLY